MKTNLLGIILLFSVKLFAQDFNCGTAQFEQSLINQQPKLEQIQNDYDKVCGQYVRNHITQKSSSTYIIPVVVHVLHTYGVENISDAQILDALDVLNKDFNKQNSDTALVHPSFANLIANVSIEFRLAQIDPNGNCTNGIDRIVSGLTNIGGDVAKLNPWPRKNYLNIWVVKSVNVSGTAAYTYRPAIVSGSNYLVDGILIKSDFIGTIGTSLPSRGRALTHEVGHLLNLVHTYQYGPTNNPQGNNCFDDSIADTPPTHGGSYFCPTPANQLCDTAVMDNYQNFMTSSSCPLIMFTPGQAQWMYAALNQSTSNRNNLWAQSNLVLTGVLNPLPPCVPVANLNAVNRYICENDSVDFTDISTLAAPTSWNWSFSGGIPSSSAVQNPSNIVYPASGNYDVSLIVANTAGSDTITFLNYVKVSPNWSDFPATKIEDFETNTADWWDILNLDNNAQKWQHAYTVGSSGTNCMMLNGDIESQGDINELISPSFDLRYMTNIALSFKFSGATRNTYILDITDKLVVSTSVDCGKTWVLRKSLQRDDLIKQGYFSASFVPNNLNQWTTESIAIPASLAVSGVRVKFTFTSGLNSNNFYLDDINFTGILGIDENDVSNNVPIVFPNPAGETISLLNTNRNDLIIITNITGEIVLQTYLNDKKAISINALSNGLYFIQVQSKNALHTAKFIKE